MKNTMPYPQQFAGQKPTVQHRTNRSNDRAYRRRGLETSRQQRRRAKLDRAVQKDYGVL